MPGSGGGAAPRCTVFVNYRRDDSGWAANSLAEAVRAQVGGRAGVFLDNQSISLGQEFARALADGVRDSAVLVALIGPRWDAPPLVDRLHDPADWVRREILLAHGQATTIVPVLVDRDGVPDPAVLPAELRFLTGLQVGRVRQSVPGDLEVLAREVAALLPGECRGVGARAPEGVEPTRAAVDALLRHILPPAQQWSGNRDRLVDLALALLARDERLVYLVPARLDSAPRGSATVLVTDHQLVVAEVGEDFRIRGEVRFPRDRVGRVEVVPGFPLFADVVVRTTGGDAVALRGLFRDQARRLADHLRG